MAVSSTGVRCKRIVTGQYKCYIKIYMTVFNTGVRCKYAVTVGSTAVKNTVTVSSTGVRCKCSVTGQYRC